MKAGQTSVRNGIEDILFPMETCNITQGDFVGTHAGTYAVDLAGRDTGRDLAYFPFSAVCKATDTPRNGNAAFWESSNPVRFADGTVDYCTLMIIHDNDLTGIYPGATYKQGVQMAQEGTAGNATGNHLHVEIAKGKFSHMYDQNQYGVYHLPNNMPIEKACFFDGTELICGTGPWIYLNDVSVETKPKPTPSKGTWNRIEEMTYTTFTPNTNINVRNEPTLSGEIVAYYEPGMAVNYDSFIDNDGYRWISYVSTSGVRRYMACQDLSTGLYYGTFR